MRWLGGIVTLVIAGGAPLMGCGGDASVEAALTLDRAAYAPGATGTVRLANEGPLDLFYNLCPRRLERRVGSAWDVATEFPENQACPAVLERLPPGASTTDAIQFPAPLPSGEYRWVFTGLGSELAASGAFEAASPSVDVVDVAPLAGLLAQVSPTILQARH
jgi:hypothetical protein